MFNQQGQYQNNNKMDTMFFNSIQLARGTYKTKSFIHLGKFLLLLIFHYVDSSVLKSNNNTLYHFMRFGMAVSIINFIINRIIICSGYGNSASNNKFLLDLAKAMGHSTSRELLNNPNDVGDLNLCVSPYLYNATNGTLNNDPALSSDIRNRYQSIYKNLIEGQVLTNQKCLPFIDLIGRIFCLAAVITGIVLLLVCNPRPSIAQLVVLGLYIGIQSFNIWRAIAAVLIIIFLPFICCFGCIYLCCFLSRSSVDRNSLSIPQAKKATAEMIEEADGSCTICLQNYKLNEKLIVLKCSPKHAFHQNCIESWLKVSNSCPICRAAIPNTI